MGWFSRTGPRGWKFGLKASQEWKQRDSTVTAMRVCSCMVEQGDPLRYDERGKALEDSSSRIGRHPALPVVAASLRGDHELVDSARRCRALIGEVTMLAQCLEWSSRCISRTPALLRRGCGRSIRTRIMWSSFMTLEVQLIVPGKCVKVTSSTLPEGGLAGILHLPVLDGRLDLHWRGRGPARMRSAAGRERHLRRLPGTARSPDAGEAADVAAQLPSALKHFWQEQERADRQVERTHVADFVARIRAWAALADDDEADLQFGWCSANCRSSSGAPPGRKARRGTSSASSRRI